MTTLTPDPLSFLDAIHREPEDVTVRLVFADWLDEHDDPARAEFIRMACELETMPPKPRELFVTDGAGNRMEGLGVSLVHEGDGHYSASSAERGLSTETFAPGERVDIYAEVAGKRGCRWMRGMKYVKHVEGRRQIIVFRKDEHSKSWAGVALSDRRTAILRDNPAWTAAPCPECNDGMPIRVVCGTCRDTRDLFWSNIPDGHFCRIDPARDFYGRGTVPFVESVGCRMEEVLNDNEWGHSQNYRQGPTPTRWSRAIADLPTMRRFRVTDREPRKWPEDDVFFWLRGGRQPHSIPELIYERLPEKSFFIPRLKLPTKDIHGRDWKAYPTPDAAISALGATLCQKVREASR